MRRRQEEQRRGQRNPKQLPTLIASGTCRTIPPGDPHFPTWIAFLTSAVNALLPSDSSPPRPKPWSTRKYLSSLLLFFPMHLPSLWLPFTSPPPMLHTPSLLQMETSPWHQSSSTQQLLMERVSNDQLINGTQRPGDLETTPLKPDN